MNLVEEAKAIGMSEIQLNAILGSLLGDGSLRMSGELTKAIRWNHGSRQMDYVRHKYSLLSEFAVKEPYIIPNPGYGDYWAVLTLRSLGLFHCMYTLLRPEGSEKKTVTKSYLDQITHPIALAWWFMDDGSRQKGENVASIHSNGFSYEENELLASWLMDKWRIAAHPLIVTHSSNSNTSTQLYIPPVGFKALIALIEDYVPECMAYKIEPAIKLCAQCGKPFFVIGNSPCCSTECSTAMRKAHKREYYEKYVEENRESVLARHAEYRESHRDEINARSREHYAQITPEQREALNEYARKWRQENREHHLATRKAWRDANKDDHHYKELRKAQLQRGYQRLKADPEKYAERLRKARERRHTPEYREKELKYQRERRARFLSEHPEIAEQRAAAKAERERQRLLTEPQRKAERAEKAAARYRAKMNAMTPEQLSAYKLEQHEKNAEQWASRTPEWSAHQKALQKAMRDSWSPEMKAFKSAQKKVSTYLLKAKRDPVQAEKWTALSEEWARRLPELKKLADASTGASSGTE